MNGLVEYILINLNNFVKLANKNIPIIEKNMESLADTLKNVKNGISLLMKITKHVNCASMSLIPLDIYLYIWTRNFAPKKNLSHKFVPHVQTVIQN